jgi:hypothetical protein
VTDRAKQEYGHVIFNRYRGARRPEKRRSLGEVCHGRMSAVAALLAIAEQINFFQSM